MQTQVSYEPARHPGGATVARTLATGLVGGLLGVVLLLGPPAAGAVSVGSSPNSGSTSWGVGVGVGSTCHDVVERMRRNWLDVRAVVAPDSKSMRPRSRNFYCVSPAYVQDSLPKPVPMTTGLQCFDIQGQGFCCDRRLEQCAAM